MKQWIKEVARGKKGSRNLTYDEARQAACTIIKGEATDAQIAALLIAERLITESAAEVIAFVEEFRAASSQIHLTPSIQSQLVDFAGPYNGRKTFAATIPVSILLAEQGRPVFLHSSDSLPPKKGIALNEILTKMGLQVDLSTEQIARSIESVHIGFAKTEDHSPPLAQIRHVREEIGVRSFLNTVEKVLNLPRAQAVMVGVFHKTVIELNAAVLRSLGYTKAYIVQGAEGSEDLPIHRQSFLYEVTQDAIHSFNLDPEEYGLKLRRDPEKENLTVQQQADYILRILAGEETEEVKYFRAQVLFNTGVRYFLLGITSSIEDGIQKAEQQLKNQNGIQHLEKWKSLQA